MSEIEKAVERVKGAIGELESKPKSKRTTKAVEMSVDEFKKFAGEEVDAAQASQDAERIALLEENITKAKEQLEGGAQAITVKVFAEETGKADGAIASLTEQVNKLSASLKETVEALKAIPPAPPAAGGKPGVPPGVPVKPKKPGEMTDEEKAAADKAAADKAAADKAAKDKAAATNKGGDGEAGDGEAGDGAQDGSDGSQDGDQDGGNGDGQDAGTTDTAKGDASWPRDLNMGRELTDVERWGTTKSLSAEERSFGPDPVDPAE